MDDEEFITIAIQADLQSIAELKSAIEPLPQARIQQQQIKSQSGDPNIWVMTGKIVAATSSVLDGVLSSILLRDTVTYVKIGSVEIKGRIKTSDLPTILAALTGAKANIPNTKSSAGRAKEDDDGRF
jgi:hypothetical protein